MREGIRYVRRRPDLMLVMVIVFFVGTFGLNFQMTSALMATEVFGKGAGEYGLLGSMLADRLAVRRAAGSPSWSAAAAAASSCPPSRSAWSRSWPG